MNSLSFVRMSGTAALTAAIFYITSTVIDLILPQTPVFTRSSDYVIEATFVIALLSTLVAYFGIHARHRGRAGRFEAASFWMTVVGTSAFSIAATGTVLAGREVLGPVFLLGVLTAFLGSICFGIAIARAGVFPRWLGIVLCLALPVGLLLESVGGGIVLGLAWLALGYGLIAEERHALSRQTA